MNGAFTGQILAEKLAKLNSSRQSIETLSHWCIFHRKKAKQVVQTWEREFHSVAREQRVPFLYLANDILQNSRRKGGEFVTEFWKVLSGALRDVVENGDDSGRNAVYRLVDIWEERRVFGSRGRSLREELLGKGPLSPVRETTEREKPTTSPSKIVPAMIVEKISAGYQSVQEGQAEEDEALQNCNYAIQQVESLEKEAESRASTGRAQGSVADDLQEQQTVLAHCIEQLESSEMTRAALVQQLKEALHEQESKLEHLRTQLQIAQAQAEQAGSVRQRLLTGSPSLSDLSPIARENGISGRDHLNSLNPDTSSMNDKDNMPRMNLANTMPPTSGTLGMERVAPLDEDKNNQQSLHASTAAEVAAKLAANTSSAAMLTSVLSSLAAEEATSMNSGVRLTGSIPLDVPASVRPLDNNNNKRQRLDGRPDGAEVLSYSMTPQMSPLQSSHQPPLPQQAPPMAQYLGGQMMSVQQQFGYGVALPPPPPPPMQGHPMMGMQQQRMGGHPQPLPPGMGGPYQPMQPPNMGYYSSPPMPAPPAPMRPQ
ncbi:unnamed protein product [Calypogeia fissa]